jgi:predicted Zn-dependent protease with MMP-like domain
VERSAFEALVAEALDDLPAEIARAMDNVEVVVEAEPRPEFLEGLEPGDTLLGYYHGIPLTERYGYDHALPDVIFIFQGPIERLGGTPAEIRAQVRRTVIHEVAHHFGIDDDRLAELGWD